MHNLFSPTKKSKILIIDDEQDICVYLKSILERTRKFEVYTSADPKEGISLARNIHPDLMLLDVIMPIMGGGEVAERLMNYDDTKDLLIVFFTVLADEEKLREYDGEIGGHPFIPKSISNEELIKRIESLLEEAQHPVN